MKFEVNELYLLVVASCVDLQPFLPVFVVELPVVGGQVTKRFEYCFVSQVCGPLCCVFYFCWGFGDSNCGLGVGRLGHFGGAVQLSLSFLDATLRLRRGGCP